MNFTHLQNLLFDCPSFSTRSTPHECKVSHKHFCCLCFTSPTLSTYQDGLAPVFISHCPDIELPESLSNLHAFCLRSLGFTQFTYTCSRHPQQQKDVDLAHQKQLLYIVPSCGRRTSVAVFGKDSLLLECCRCKSVYFRTDRQFCCFVQECYCNLVFIGLGDSHISH